MLHVGRINIDLSLRRFQVQKCNNVETDIEANANKTVTLVSSLEHARVFSYSRTNKEGCCNIFWVLRCGILNVVKCGWHVSSTSLFLMHFCFGYLFPAGPLPPSILKRQNKELPDSMSQVQISGWVYVFVAKLPNT